ncbi:nucleotide exchange factor GrpE [Arthrobacter monumenti]
MADKNDPKVDPPEDPENDAGIQGEGAEVPSPAGEEEIIEAEVVDGPGDGSDPSDSDASGDGGAGSTDRNMDVDEGDALAQAEAILDEEASKSESEVLAAERLVDLQRLQAEYVNYRRRVERDRDVAREMAVISVLNSLLPVLDDIEAARQHGDLDGSPFASISNKLDAVLNQHGLVRYGEVGVEFDPNIHEALLQQPSTDVEVETVSHVLRAGYKSGDRVLRAAQVGVSVPE